MEMVHGLESPCEQVQDMCVAWIAVMLRECKSMEVEVAAQGYDGSGPIMVIEQRDCGSGMGAHPGWMVAEARQECMDGILEFQINLFLW